mmetsp:Transcript_3336/g.5241  ORF Transcript_3336/g.5241 Transcript_3336/m.5241 type:complete len:563 (+) Transcript_3336:121-1809(+)
MISLYSRMLCLFVATGRMVLGFSIALPQWSPRSSRDGSFLIKRGTCYLAKTNSNDNRDIQRHNIFADGTFLKSTSRGFRHNGIATTEGELVFSLEQSLHDRKNVDIRELEALILQEETPEELVEIEHGVERKDNYEFLKGVNCYDPLGLSSRDLDDEDRGVKVMETTHTSCAPTESTGISSGPSNNDQQVWIARLLVLISAALYGTNFTFVKILSESIPVGAGAAVRFSLASFATLYWLIQPVDTEHEDYEDNTFRLEVILAGLEVGMWNACGYVAQAVGLQTTDASKSAFICSLAVVVVPILDALTGKHMPLNSIIGAIMALLGVSILEIGDGDIHSALSLSSGDLASLVQPLVFGMGFWRMEDAMHKYPSEAPRLTAAQLFSVAVVSVSYCLLGGGGVDPPALHQIVEWVTDPSLLTALLWTGLVTTALTIYLETLALKTLSAAETTLLFSTEPLWGAAFATFMLSEKLGVGAAVGAALILGGIYVTNSPTAAPMEQEEKVPTLVKDRNASNLFKGGIGVTSLVSLLQQSMEMESNEIQALSATSALIAATDATKDVYID